MAQLNIVRVLALPDPLVANTVYLVSKSPTELQIVTVGNTAADVRSTIVATNVDDKIATANAAQTTSLQGEIAAGDAATLAAAGTAANAYADAGDAATLAAAGTAAAAGDAATLSSANTYADSVGAATLSAAATNAANGDAATLASANSYTDGAVSAAIGNLDLSNSAQLVADIAARDLLELTKNSFVLVSDASADATVDAGAALYFYNTGDDSYLKIAEYESLDIVIPNKTILEAFSDVGGQLYYKGAAVGTVHAGTMEW